MTMAKKDMSKYTVHHDNVTIHLDDPQNVKDYIRRLEEDSTDEDLENLDVSVYKHTCVFDYQKDDSYEL